jgi:hypothetical protein
VIERDKIGRLKLGIESKALMGRGHVHRIINSNHVNCLLNSNLLNKQIPLITSIICSDQLNKKIKLN